MSRLGPQLANRADVIHKILAEWKPPPLGGGLQKLNEVKIREIIKQAESELLAWTKRYSQYKQLADIVRRATIVVSELGMVRSA